MDVLNNFWLVFTVSCLSIAFYRVAPLMLLSGKDLSESTTRILKLIPVAAFSALVANDLLNDKVLHAHSMADLISLIACIPVIIVACKTKSLSLCILVGVVSYAALKFFI